MTDYTDAIAFNVKANGKAWKHAELPVFLHDSGAADSQGFASAVERFQQYRELPVSGCLDSATLARVKKVVAAMSKTAKEGEA